MSDGHDHGSMPKQMMSEMSDSMMESMAPMMGAIALLGDEAKAWDQHACEFIATLAQRIPKDKPMPVDAAQQAMAYADDMIAGRRERFNEDTFKERMRGILPSGRGLCSKPILRDDGSDTGSRCPQNVGHAGICF